MTAKRHKRTLRAASSPAYRSAVARAERGRWATCLAITGCVAVAGCSSHQTPSIAQRTGHWHLSFRSSEASLSRTFEYCSGAMPQAMRAPLAQVLSDARNTCRGWSSARPDGSVVSTEICAVRGTIAASRIVSSDSPTHSHLSTVDYAFGAGQRSKIWTDMDRIYIGPCPAGRLPGERWTSAPSP
jgi:hypothetical protein